MGVLSLFAAPLLGQPADRSVMTVRAEVLSTSVVEPEPRADKNLGVHSTELFTPEDFVHELRFRLLAPEEALYSIDMLNFMPMFFVNDSEHPDIDPWSRDEITVNVSVGKVDQGESKPNVYGIKVDYRPLKDVKGSFWGNMTATVEYH